MNDRSQARHEPAFTRRYDLDWLRIAAFVILIGYHVGMFFVTWDWHVKSPDANDEAELVMMLINPWRLALLFFISGVALRFLSDRLGATGFARERAIRLFPVIIFGVVIVVAPQTYFQLRQSGAIEPGFVSFYADYLQPSILFGIITPTWNHLWYIVYLLVYSLLLAPFFPTLRRVGQSLGRVFNKIWLSPAAPVLLIVLPTLPFMAYRIWLDPQFPTTHALVDDWANHAHRLTILLIGYYAAKSPAFWEAVKRSWILAALVAAGYAVVFGWAIRQPDAFWSDKEIVLWAVRLGRIVFAWSVILALLGVAQAWLRHSNGPILRYLTEAIFPVYILHQTITVAAGFYIAQLDWNVWGQFSALVLITAIGSFVVFEGVRRVSWLRPVFGLKPASPKLS